MKTRKIEPKKTNERLYLLNSNELHALRGGDFKPNDTDTKDEIMY